MEHYGCVGCVHEKEPANGIYCSGCTENAVDRYERATKADIIRSMSDEELAKVILRFAQEEEPNFCREMKSGEKMEFGKRLKQARKKAGLTQQQLAEKVGMAYQQIGRYETGKRNPKKETIAKIEEAIKVGYSYTKSRELKECNEMLDNGDIVPDKMCEECVLQWLKQEVTNG